jgi:DNA primase
MATLEEAKNIIKETPISSIISFYHPITKKGGNYEGLCPFHADSHPSMKVNDSKGIYKCFVCGHAGDAIKFVQDLQSSTFVEAVKDIAEKIGITVEEQKKFKPNPEFEMGLRVINSAYKLYRKVATETTPPAFKEFIAKRNLNEESIKNFGLGYAPANNAFTSYLGTIPEKDRDLAINSALKIKHIREGKWGHYDFFRERVMFPIWDHSGNIRGFTARAVKDDQIPKYLNSSESFIFNKGNILYGFNLARNEIRSKDAVILVEGNMDVIVLHQFGFKHSVGTMGVALSENSVKLLTNLTKNIYLGMDSDNAGIAAMEKINAAFMEQGILAKFVSFDPAKDPDEFLNEYGRLELTERIENAPTYLDFAINKALPDPIPSATDAKLQLLKVIFDLVSPLKENLVAKEKVIQAAKSLGLHSSNEDIVDAYKQFLQEQEQSTFKKPVAPVVQEIPPEMIPTEEIHETNTVQHEEIVPPMEQAPIPKTQKLLLEKLVTHPECLETSQMLEILDLMGNNGVQLFVQWLKKIYLEIDDNEYVNIVKTKLSSEEFGKEIKDIVASALFHFSHTRLNEKVIKKLMDDFLFRLKEDHLKQQRDELRTKQKQSLTQEESFAIINEIQNLEQRLFELKANRS